MFLYKLRHIVGFGLIEMAISTNPKPTMCRSLYENTGPVPAAAAGIQIENWRKTICSVVLALYNCSSDRSLQSNCKTADARHCLNVVLMPICVVDGGPIFKQHCPTSSVCRDNNSVNHFADSPMLRRICPFSMDFFVL